MFSTKQVMSTTAVVLLILTVTAAIAAEEKQTIIGHIYCVLPTAEGLKLEPGVCPGARVHVAHLIKTEDGKVIVLEEAPLLRDIPKLTAEEKKRVTVEGEMKGTVFSPEAIKWPWFNK